jgi:hypothetical protein
MANDDSAKDRAEATFKQAPAIKAKAAVAEHDAAAQAVREKTARLRALRLAKEEAEETGADTTPTGPSASDRHRE